MVLFFGLSGSILFLLGSSSLVFAKTVTHADEHLPKKDVKPHAKANETTHAPQPHPKPLLKNETFTLDDAAKPFYLEVILQDGYHSQRLTVGNPHPDGRLGVFGNPFMKNASIYEQPAEFKLRRYGKSHKVNDSITGWITFHYRNESRAPLWLVPGPTPLRMPPNNETARFAIVDGHAKLGPLNATSSYTSLFLPDAHPKNATVFPYIIDHQGFLYPTVEDALGHRDPWWLIRFDRFPAGKNKTEVTGALAFGPHDSKQNSTRGYFTHVRVRAVPIAALNTTRAHVH